MWCGECYSLKNNKRFHISKASVDGKEVSEEHQARMELQWGKRGERKESYLVGRNGDHLMCPFECDTCIFRKLKGRDSKSSSESDNLLLEFIRRANMDAFWSRASSTVLGN